MIINILIILQYSAKGDVINFENINHHHFVGSFFDFNSYYILNKNYNYKNVLF